MIQYVLGIETSCDDTSCAIVDKSGFVHAMKSANQDTFHKPFGGIVPEIASRNHTENILPLLTSVLKEAKLDLKDIDGIAVTNRPGLLGSLLVGLVTAKTLALSLNRPWIGVHHIEGHLMAPFLSDDEYKAPQWDKPFLSLAVSGGHTQLFKIDGFGQYKLLGSTVDDAAGEAFDKFAKMLGLEYPGGVQIDRLSKLGNKKKFDFPRSMVREDHHNFSFSGLKSSAQRMLESMNQDEIENNKNDLCASYQEAIVDVLFEKTYSALKKYSLKHVTLTGGVSANSSLRERFLSLKEKGIEVAFPPLKYCTDNAAMIALVGMRHLAQGKRSGFEEGAFARADLGVV